ncbi:MAG: hypothetical protein OXU81_13670 [Gammaproteobacteria bacterium]|nr:hypothetical protein [Gammaproteobacteria bacterium]
MSLKNKWVANALVRQGCRMLKQAITACGKARSRVTAPSGAGLEWRPGIASLWRTQELTRAGLKCCQMELVDGLVTLVRPQYEAGVRSYIYIHELRGNMEEIAQTLEAKDAEAKFPEVLPEIAIRQGKWRVQTTRPWRRTKWFEINDERVATLHQRILPRHYQNDFTHGGTRALLGYCDVEKDRLSVQPNNEVGWPITLGALRSLHITLTESTRATLE